MALAMTAALLMACGSDPADTAPADTTPAGTAPVVVTTDVATTLAPTPTSSTTAAPTTSAPPRSTTTTSTALGRVGFDPPCVERDPERPTAVVDEATLDRLGPIGVVPAMRLVLPDGYSAFDGSQQDSTSMTTRIPGGMLVVIVSSYFPESMLMAVDHDGHVRWQRCFDERVVTVAAAPASERPGEAVVVTSSYVDDEFRTSWWSISLDDGLPTSTLTDHLDRLGLPDHAVPAGGLLFVSGDPLVLGPDGAHVVDVDVDRLAVVDLADLAVSAVPLPPEFEGHPAGELQLEIGAGGELLRMGLARDLVHRVPNSMWTGGAWSTDPARLRAAWPTTAGYGYQPSADGGMPMLESYDALGEVRWRRDDLRLMLGEGFHAGVFGDRVVAISCRPITGDQMCSEFRTGAYSLATGATLWEVDGFRSVTAAGDGLAMMSTRAGDESSSGWALVDLATGDPVRADQVWLEPTAFLTECCGGYEYQRVDQHDGVLAVQTGGALLVYLPEQASHPTIDIDPTGSATEE